MYISSKKMAMRRGVAMTKSQMKEILWAMPLKELRKTYSATPNPARSIRTHAASIAATSFREHSSVDAPSFDVEHVSVDPANWMSREEFVEKLASAICRYREESRLKIKGFET